jgi:protein phosphatase
VTDVGLRRSHNQDAWSALLASDDAHWEKQGHIFLVADGMGGHAVGEKASAQAARDIPHTYQKYAGEGPVPALRKAFSEANAGIHTIGQENPEFKGMGTTATAVVLRPEGAWVGHVGDSRAYRVRDGHIEQLSYDHSATWEFARRQGIAPEDVQGIHKNVIFRSLGPDAFVQVDIEGPHPLKPGDVFVVCSDGLSNPVSNEEIGAVASALPPDEACRVLVELANLRGGPDNVTVMVVRIGDAPDAPDPIDARKSSLLGGWNERVGWPMTTLLAGVGFAVAFVVALATETPGAIALFVLALIAVGVGLVGLGIRTKQQEQLRQFDDWLPDEVHIYRQHPCRVERPLIDRFARMGATLRQNVRGKKWKVDWDAHQHHRDQGDKSMQAGDLPGAFREECRALYLLAKEFNKHRQKEEDFRPNWEQNGAE